MGSNRLKIEYFKISTVENKYNSNRLREFEAISLTVHNMRGIGLIPHQSYLAHASQLSPCELHPMGLEPNKLCVVSIQSRQFLTVIRYVLLNLFVVIVYQKTIGVDPICCRRCSKFLLISCRSRLSLESPWVLRIEDE